MSGEELEVLVTSVGEPQLERCLDAVNSQTIPFGAVTHISGVIPAVEAFRVGLRKISREWFVHIGGDMILYLDAVETVLSWMNKSEDPSVWKYVFGVHDTFLEDNIGSCTVMKTDATRMYWWSDRLNYDWYGQLHLRRLGYQTRRVTAYGFDHRADGRALVPIATHFDDPDLFQVFCRFSRMGARGANPSGFKKKHGSKEDYRYAFAIKSWEFGLSHQRNMRYESINAETESNLYKEFVSANESIGCDSDTKQPRGSETADTSLQQDESPR